MCAWPGPHMYDFENYAVSTTALDRLSKQCGIRDILSITENPIFDV